MSETGCTPSKPSEVKEQLIKIGTSITSLSETVDSLYTRLETLTRSQPQPDTCVDAKEQELVPIASEIRDFNSRIRNEIERLKDLRERIEL